jgi:NAD(P)-dependent dehydrogenase (short-subunit alcohol dehydrogenase family)
VVARAAAGGATAMSRERVLITGTTSGVGLALLASYVQRGASVIAVNRRRVSELEAKYPGVRFEQIDVRSTEAVDDLLVRLQASSQLPDVFVLNAGVNRVDNDEAFDLAAFDDVVRTNLYGVLGFVERLTRLPASTSPRHIIAVSSMANYVGNPYGLGYHASKRALTACFDAWSRMYAGTDLIFQQLMLGPVRTGMYTMDHTFPAWMVWLRDAFSTSLDGAVRALLRLATSRRRKLFHPLRAVPLYLGMWLGQALVPGFFQGRKTRAGRIRRAPSLPQE